jgi:hypothetical protein
VWLWVRVVFAVLFLPWRKHQARSARFTHPNAAHASMTDLMLEIALRLALTDHLGSQWFSIRAARFAVQSDDARALGRSAAYLYLVSALLGRVDTDWDEISDACERVAGATESSQACRAFSHHIVAFFRGSLADAIETGARFEAHASRMPANLLAPEKILVRFFSYWSGVSIGRYETAAPVRASAREAIRRNDPLAAIYMGEQCASAWLITADLRGLHEIVDGSTRFLDPESVSLQHYLRLSARLEIALIDGSDDSSHHWAAFEKQMGSVLVLTDSVQMMTGRNSMLGLVHAMRTKADPTRWSRVAKKLGRSLSGHNHIIIRCGAAEARIAHALAARDDARIRTELRAAVEVAKDGGAEGLAMTYAHRLGRYLRDAEGDALIEEAESYLSRGGVRDPKLFAMLWSPLPDDEFSPGRTSLVG